MPFPRHSGSVDPPQIPANSVPSTRASRPEQTTCAPPSRPRRPRTARAPPSGRAGRASPRRTGRRRRSSAATSLASVTIAVALGQLVDPADGHPLGQLDVDREVRRLADHHGLDLLGLQPVCPEPLVEVGRPVVTAGLPLELLDLRVAGEERDGLGDQGVDRLEAAEALERLVADEPARGGTAPATADRTGPSSPPPAPRPRRAAGRRTPRAGRRVPRRWPGSRPGRRSSFSSSFTVRSRLRRPALPSGRAMRLDYVDEAARDAPGMKKGPCRYERQGPFGW